MKTLRRDSGHIQEKVKTRDKVEDIKKRQWSHSRNKEKQKIRLKTLRRDSGHIPEKVKTRDKVEDIKKRQWSHSRKSKNKR